MLRALFCHKQSLSILLIKTIYSLVESLIKKRKFRIYNNSKYLIKNRLKYWLCRANSRYRKERIPTLRISLGTIIIAYLKKTKLEIKVEVILPNYKEKLTKLPPKVKEKPLIQQKRTLNKMIFNTSNSNFNLLSCNKNTKKYPQNQISNSKIAFVANFKI